MLKLIMPFTVEEKVLSISFVAAKGLIQIFLNGLKLKFIIIRCGEKRVKLLLNITRVKFIINISLGIKGVN